MTNHISIRNIALIALLIVLATPLGAKKTAACDTNSKKVTNGFATHFTDNIYACSKWSNKAQKSKDCFVALNGVCGMQQLYCGRCVAVTNSLGTKKKCTIIDFCDPKNCDFKDPGHLDILDNNNRKNYDFFNKGKNAANGSLQLHGVGPNADDIALPKSNLALFVLIILSYIVKQLYAILK